MAQREFDAARRDRHILTVLIVALLGTAICFRLLYLSSIPGISGDEGWWGVQATAWLSARPYETHTTSGNPTDLFLLIPIGLVHTVVAPSFLALRTVPALANVLALPIGFWLVRRVYGETTAWIQTVALAVMPTAIAHGRICQDPSQTVLWTSLAIYLSMLGFRNRRRAWVYGVAVLLLFPVVLWTHPTNVFIAPFLLIPLVTAVWPLLPAARTGKAMLIVSAALLVVIGLFVLRVALEHVAGANEYVQKPWLSVAAARLLDGRQWFEFAANNARLFNGVTIYHYFSGARPATMPYDAGFVLVAVAALGGFAVTSAARRDPLDYALILACAGTWIGFYAFAGPEALRPHFERWGLCLIVPGTLVLARGLTSWIASVPRIRWLTIGAAAVIASSLLASFYINYFREFRTSGGRSHLTYVTAPVEPKQQAFDHVLASAVDSAPVTIVAQQWWLRLPMTYLATKHPNVSVTMELASESQPAFQDALRAGRLFLVEFVGTPELSADIAWLRARGLRSTSTIVRDAGGRDLLEILQVAAPR